MGSAQYRLQSFLSPTGKPPLLSPHWSESYRVRGTTWLEHKGSALGKIAVVENASGAFGDVGFQLRGAQRNSGGWAMSLSEVPSACKLRFIPSSDELGNQKTHFSASKESLGHGLKA